MYQASMLPLAEHCAAGWADNKSNRQGRGDYKKREVPEDVESRLHLRTESLVADEFCFSSVPRYTAAALSLCPLDEARAERAARWAIKMIRRAGAGVGVAVEKPLPDAGLNIAARPDMVVYTGSGVDVYDFKFGSQEPDAGSGQMRVYGLLAGKKAGLPPDGRVRLLIPWIPADGLPARVLICRLTMADLDRWADDMLLPLMARAREDGERNPGEWCTLCPRASKCTARGQAALAELAKVFSGAAGRDLTEAERARVLDCKAGIDTYMRTVRQEMDEDAKRGVRFPGYELAPVACKSAWTDAAKLADVMAAAGYRADVYTQAKTPAAVKRAVGGAEWDRLGLDALVDRHPDSGKRTLKKI